LLFGATTPWQRVKLTLGLGTRLTSLTIKSSGSKITSVVPSRYSVFLHYQLFQRDPDHPGNLSLDGCQFCIPDRTHADNRRYGCCNSQKNIRHKTNYIDNNGYGLKPTDLLDYSTCGALSINRRLAVGNNQAITGNRKAR
jgi:hypothetical protein